MTESLARLASQLVAVALLLAIPASIAGLGGLPLWRWYQNLEARIEHLELERARLVGHARSLEPLEQHNQTLSHQLVAQKLTFAGGSRDVLAAKIQQVLSNAVISHSGQLHQAHFAEGASTDTQPSVALTLRFAISNDGLIDLLQAIDRHKPIIQIDSLLVRPGVIIGQPSPKNSTVDGPYRTDPVLEVSLQARGFLDAAVKSQ